MNHEINTTEVDGNKNTGYKPDTKLIERIMQVLDQVS